MLPSRQDRTPNRADLLGAERTPFLSVKTRSQMLCLGHIQKVVRIHDIVSGAALTEATGATNSHGVPRRQTHQLDPYRDGVSVATERSRSITIFTRDVAGDPKLDVDRLRRNATLLQQSQGIDRVSSLVGLHAEVCATTHQSL